jgi:flagellar hook-associated protein 2
MAGLSLGGLASGMDTDAVISQLMALESQSKTRLTVQQYKTEARKTALDQVATKLRALKSAADDLKSVGTWGNVQTVESTDAARVGARFVSGAAVGSYSIEVTQLARADQRFYDYTAPASASTISIASGADPAVTIDVAANATVDDVAAAINAASTSPAFASVVDGQLVLSGKKTGVGLTVTAPDLAEDTAKHRAARMAIYEIDGVEQPHSLSNTVTNGLAGIELTLKSLTTSPVTVTVGAPGPDQTKLKEKLTAFVDAYNSTVDLIKAKTEEKTVRSPSLMSDYGKGVLRGDPGLTGLLSRLRQTVGDVFAGDPGSPNPAEYDQLSDIGIGVPAAEATGQVTADRLAGKLVIDDAKLTAALSDPVAVRRLLGGISGVDGAAQAIAGVLDPVARTGDGELAERSEAATREVNRIKDRQLAMDQRLKMKEERLRAQFTAMETALASSQSSMSWLTSQISGLASWSS